MNILFLKLYSFSNCPVGFYMTIICSNRQFDCSNHKGQLISKCPFSFWLFPTLNMILLWNRSRIRNGMRFQKICEPIVTSLHKSRKLHYVQDLKRQKNRWALWISFKCCLKICYSDNGPNWSPFMQFFEFTKYFLLLHSIF